ncbi:DUF3718 domain-containing protein [Alteromonas sp. 1_MG-2023]|uniref:DUF3718 domain-containing protein n=1 Tax=Alteromonas sp. 1_MG-2023 TaxID=3062669 RepID=UPI0026E2ABC7|nr:DUF3718 domain-containing protein [Alteromonas sp. 1_MG-2023]MDO6565529.1 DUF3718 domain-containing protein [Alteromonas sp. 1_MG-2023]
MDMSRHVRLPVLFGFGATLALAASLANANGYPESSEKDLVAVCEAIQDDNRLALHKAVKRSRISYKDLHKGLVCNGEDMLSFAQSNNAISTGDYLARRVNAEKSVLTAKR